MKGIKRSLSQRAIIMSGIISDMSRKEINKMLAPFNDELPKRSYELLCDFYRKQDWGSAQRRKNWLNGPKPMGKVKK